MANWSEYIQSRPVTTRPDRAPRRSIKLPAWLTDLESWLTFALVVAVFLSVAHSVDDAGWVRRMPSLTSVSFIALLTGLLLARVRAPEIILHLFALLAGAIVVSWLMLQFIDEPTLRRSAEGFKDRWADWFRALRKNEPITDNMPFVTIVLSSTWVSAYLASWSIFRWRNAWLAIIPAGVGLLTNISYLPNQFSADFVIFLFGAMLLVMRVHLLNKVREWKAKDTPYPDFLSLRLLNVTTWVALAAILIAWRLPQANEVRPVASAWERIAGPLVEGDHFIRLFSNIDSKREVPLHAFGDTLPLQGQVTLSNKIAAQLELPAGMNNPGRPLRAKVYDIYTSGGWKAGPRSETSLAPDETVPSGAAPRAAYRDRAEFTVTFVTEQGFPKNVLPTVGQPLRSSVNSRVEVISTDPVVDIDSVRARNSFKLGDNYVTSGNISNASVEKLRGAGTNYPAYINERYLQLPNSLPQRVRQLALDLTRDRTTPYDKARAIEDHLRLVKTTFDVEPVPPGRDAVDYFLFEGSKTGGYFDYQASAMVVLLRAVGVPARLAVGYNIDEFDLSLRRYLIREKHAYAWPEVYFPGYGWQEFSPYAGASQIARPTEGGQTDTIIGDEELIREPPGLDFGEFDGPEVIGVSPNAPTGAGRSFAWVLPVLYTLAAVVVAAGTFGIGLRVAWERGLSGLDQPSRLWEKTVRLASWMRLGPKPHQTPHEYSTTLSRALPGTAEGLSVVADSYQRSRYGRRDLNPADEEQLDAVWKPLRNQLLKKLLRLK